MHRIPGKVAGSVAALAAVALLSACGGNDSTASQTPTLSSSASAPAASTQAPAPSADEHGGHAPSSSAAPESSAPEQPAPAPETSAPSAPASAKDQAFLDELSKNGITPASPDIALTAANYICSSRATGASDADIAPFVAAIAGSDANFDESKMDVDKASQVYIAAATSTYC
ncbi:DUF732 domain-containing protein [Nocardia sp. AG03]|uniref:DUF732 domain-containing protein n=1 Tax=Nocardia sp. AG03 TaxID=3025312 RepID=UPI002418439F|nr:DUF732 domain-containing protein [Nocardia sp. AG03]